MNVKMLVDECGQTPLETFQVFRKTEFNQFINTCTLTTVQLVCHSPVRVMKGWREANEIRILGVGRKICTAEGNLQFGAIQRYKEEKERETAAGKRERERERKRRRVIKQ